MTYRELDPPAALGRWVECAWEVVTGGEERRIVPDGCIDVVWTPAGLQLVGANSTAFTVAMEPGARASGVRLHPGAAPALLGVHGESVRDARVPLTDAYGAGALALEERMAIGAPRERTSLLLGWLAVRARTAPAPDPLIRATARALAVGPDRRIGALARELHVSERHLRHRVTAQVGYGPKRLGRVLRLRRALAAARAGAGLAAASHVGGYADQPHFTSDCVALAGVPPGQLV